MLLEDLKNLHGATIVTLTASTQPKLKSGSNLTGLTKLSTVQAIIGASYANCVNNQREREGLEQDFKPEPRKWGERAGCLVHHKGKIYLECRILKSLGHMYWLNGPVPDDRVKPFLPTTSSRQGTEKEIIWRDYSLTSLQKVSMLGKVYERSEIM
jgi:hypothetical protein